MIDISIFRLKQIAHRLKSHSKNVKISAETFRQIIFNKNFSGDESRRNIVDRTNLKI